MEADKKAGNRQSTYVVIEFAILKSSNVNKAGFSYINAYEIPSLDIYNNKKFG